MESSRFSAFPTDWLHALSARPVQHHDRSIITTAALRSTLPWCPHAVHTNRAWLSQPRGCPRSRRTHSFETIGLRWSFGKNSFSFEGALERSVEILQHMGLGSLADSCDPTELSAQILQVPPLRHIVRIIICRAPVLLPVVDALLYRTRRHTPAN